MSQYPVESDEQLYQAVNYLLSGPGGLGQDFNGVQQWAPGWITGNFRIPYTQNSVNHNCTGTSGDTFVSCNPDALGVAVGMTVHGYGIASGTTVTSIGSGTATGVQVNLSAAITEDIDNDLYFYPVVIPQLYIAPIALGTSTLLDPQTWKFEFATPQAAPPFARGNPIIVANVKSASTSPKGSYPTSFSLSGTKAVLGTETTYSNIFPTTLTGSGSGYEVSITLTATGAVAYSDSNTNISRESRGSNYGVGDTLLIPGTSLGGTSPANDLTLTITKTSSIYDGEYAPVGVVDCTTTYVIAKTTASYSADATGTGGTVEYYQTSSVPSVFALSTDCNSKIVVNGGTDRVFISAQLTNQISYQATTSSDLNYAVAINRYKGFPNNDVTNPGYLFILDKLIAKKVYSIPSLNGTGTLDEIDTVFSTFPDSGITPGYYWYIMDVSFQVTNGGDLQVTQSQLGLRSMSTQVVKQ